TGEIAAREIRGRDVAAVADAGGAVVGAGEHAHRHVAAAGDVDAAAVGDVHVAGVGQPEHAGGLAEGVALDRAGVVDADVALRRHAEHAEAAAEVGVELDVAAAGIGDAHVTHAGGGEHAVGVLAVRVQSAA